MKILNWNSLKDRKHISNILGQSKVVLTSTDTVLGLLVPVSYQGFKELNRIKKRQEKPYVILVGSLEGVKRFVKECDYFQLENFMKKCWPGPVTLVMPAHEDLPAYLKAPDGTVALRIPAHKGLLELLEKFDGLFSTSANTAGNPTPMEISAIEKEVLENVASVVIEPLQNTPRVPSTIVAWQDQQLKLLRKGAYPLSELENELLA